MDLGIIIAIAGSSIATIGVVISMMFWVRSEGNELRKEQKEDRKDFLQLTRSMENTVRSIEMEMKDFHYKLLEIERSRKGN